MCDLVNKFANMNALHRCSSRLNMSNSKFNRIEKSIEWWCLPPLHTIWSKSESNWSTGAWFNRVSERCSGGDDFQLAIIQSKSKRIEFSILSNTYYYENWNRRRNQKLFPNGLRWKVKFFSKLNITCIKPHLSVSARFASGKNITWKS